MIISVYIFSENNVQIKQIVNKKKVITRVVKGMIPDRIFHPHRYPQKIFPSLFHPRHPQGDGMG
jgi:hypothetical protein